MATMVSPQNETVSISVSYDTKHILQQAASLSGQTLPEFMESCLRDRAHQLVEERQEITLSAEDYNEIVAALDMPSRPVSPFAAEIINDFVTTMKEDGTYSW